MPRELANALAEGLSAAGVRRLFGLPGGGPNLDMIGAAADHGIDFVLTHGETAACVMAPPSTASRCCCSATRCPGRRPTEWLTSGWTRWQSPSHSPSGAGRWAPSTPRGSRARPPG